MTPRPTMRPTIQGQLAHIHIQAFILGAMLPMGIHDALDESGHSVAGHQDIRDSRAYLMISPCSRDRGERSQCFLNQLERTSEDAQVPNVHSAATFATHRE